MIFAIFVIFIKNFHYLCIFIINQYGIEHTISNITD